MYEIMTYKQINFTFLLKKIVKERTEKYIIDILLKGKNKERVRTKFSVIKQSLHKIKLYCGNANDIQNKFLSPWNKILTVEVEPINFVGKKTLLVLTKAYFPLNWAHDN